MRINRFLPGIATSFFLALTAASCMGPPTPVGYRAGDATSSPVTRDEDLDEYRSLASAKVVFNKASFYNNTSPAPEWASNGGCAGDARYYFDPATNRKLPTKPDWLLNVAVELTNSNAPDGASLASGCAYTGGGSPQASTCASFDDQQALQGKASRNLLYGGAVCTGAACTSTASDELWGFFAEPDSKDNSFTLHTTPDIGGRAWAAGDFDELHNEFYVFGGVDSAGAMSTELAKLTLRSDGGLKSATHFAIPVNSTYGGWSDVAAGAPVGMVGATLTYSGRRDPSMKSFEKQIAPADPTTAAVENEHSDYLLLAGGVHANFTISDEDLWAYKPHALSNDGMSPPADGDWMRLSSKATEAEILSIANVAQNEDGGFDVDKDGTLWKGRAFHRTAYDPFMNRFYIFGGLESGAGALDAEEPVLAGSEMWVYDPPALGRKPTSACWTEKMPDNEALATPGTIMGAFRNLGITRNYLAAKRVFPPGGCLQRLDVAPDNARFEHSMAFDRAQKAVVVFGGCTQPSKLSGSGANPYDPLTSCTPTNLKNDTWLYVPPTVTEYDPTKLYGGTNPILPSVFGLDFWLSWLPKFLTWNLPDSELLEAPRAHQALGVWIKLDPAEAPSPRASASLVYDRTHRKFYLQGGYGCATTDASGDCIDTSAENLSDLWEFTPPNLEADCDPEEAQCSSGGTWKLLRAHKPTPENNEQPHPRRGALFVHAQPMFGHGDEFYTVNDAACAGQGPVLSYDPAISKKNVGAIYIDIDRSQFDSSEGILINLRFLPYDASTRAPGYIHTLYGDHDASTTQDTAEIRVQLLRNSGDFVSYQPRFHDFILSNLIAVPNFMQVAGATGQITEKQIFVPLPSLDPSINLIKIERVTGSAKFFEMSVYKF